MWINHIENPERVNKFFTALPQLDNLLITTFSLEKDHSLKIGVELNQFPDKRLYKLSDGNTCAITFHFTDLIDITIQGWAEENYIDLSFNKYSCYFKVKCYSKSCSIKFLCRKIYISDVGVYVT
ncbi:hypothetical protein IC620_15080 [Hazenella sp. IB182357]|uniref:Uncharacterized protein n=1 Tax=Polycladospora coralii TaxID=2771432 RepID=A0A926N6X9_9BACL|nr:hypothetical protein [Polycladospora coralii]